MLGKKKQSDSPTAPAEEARPRGKRRSVSKKGGKGKSFVILIGDDGAILVYMEGNKVVRRLFAPSAQPASTEAMVTLLRQHPTVPLSLLVDSIDQQYVRQSFPPVSSLSLKGLVKRRLERDFPPEDLTSSLPLGRDKDGRKEWNFLLISLAKTAGLTEWLDLVSEMPNELTGVYLMPVEATVYLQMLNASAGNKSPNPWQLLVTHNKVSGFRQVVVHQGKLAFTRVSQAIDEAQPAVIAGNVEQEIINTIEYLRRLGFQDANGLDITVVASSDVIEVLDLKRFNLGFTQALSPLDVADALGLEQAALSADRFGDVVMASSFLRARKHILRLSTAYIDSLAKLYFARRAAKVATVLIVLGLLGLSGMNLMAMAELQQQISESESKRMSLQGELNKLKKEVSELNSDLTFKSTIVSAHDIFLKDAPVPMDFVRTLAGLITPEQRVTSFSWARNNKVATPANAKQAARAAQGKNAPAATAKGLLEVKVELEFLGRFADLDELSKAEQAFLNRLADKMPLYTVDHDPFPWLKGGENSMEISFDQKQAAIRAGDNKLTVTFNGPKEEKPAAAAKKPKAPAKGKTQ